MSLGAERTSCEENRPTIVGPLGLAAVEHAFGHLLLAGLHEDSVEPYREAVEGINILADARAESSLEIELGGGDGVQIKHLEWHLADLAADNDILERIADKHLVVNFLLHGRHVKTVDVLPEGDVVGYMVWVCQWGNVEGAVTWDKKTIRLEVSVPGIEDRVKHGFVEKSVSHPLAHNDVDFVNRERDFLNLTPDQGDLIGETVSVDIGTGFIDNVRVVYSNNTGCTGFGAEQGQDSRTAADIKDSLSGEEMLVAVDEVAVRVGTDSVLQHSLVNIWEILVT